MKKTFSLMPALLLTLALHTACGGGSAPDNIPSNNGSGAPPASISGGNNGSSTDTPASANPPQKRIVEVPEKPLDLTDNSIYFVIIDGLKINLQEATVQDFLNIGFVFNEEKDDEDYFDENSEVDANSAAEYGYNFGARLYKEGTKAYIEVYAVNLADHSLPLKDCEISTVYFDERIGSAFDISVACNLSYGCTEEEIKSVFGEIADDILTQTAYGRNQIRYYAEGHGEFWFITKDTNSGVFRQVGVHTAKMPMR